MAGNEDQIGFHQAQIALLSSESTFVGEFDAKKFSKTSEVNSFIKKTLGEMCQKQLVGNKDCAAGGRQTSLVCSHKEQGCMFQILCKKSKPAGSTFKVIQSNLVHGGVGVMCGSVWKPSSKDLACNAQFNALHAKAGGNKRKAGQKSISIIQSTMALNYGSLAPTTDVVKKANKRLKFTPQEHLSTYQFILPMCEMAKEQNPNFCYDVTKDDKNVFRRMAILFPFSKTALKCGFNVIGLDAAHMGTIMLGNLTSAQLEAVGREDLIGRKGLMLSKLYLTLATGRTLNNEAIVYGYMLHHNENANDLFYFLKFQRRFQRGQL